MAAACFVPPREPVLDPGIPSLLRGLPRDLVTFIPAGPGMNVTPGEGGPVNRLAGMPVGSPAPLPCWLAGLAEDSLNLDGLRQVKGEPMPNRGKGGKS